MKVLIVSALAALYAGPSMAWSSGSYNLRLSSLSSSLSDPFTTDPTLPPTKLLRDGGDDCAGQVEESCSQSCPDGESNGDCDAINSACKSSLCSLCTTYTWDCDFTTKDPIFNAVTDPFVKEALCTQIRNHFCVEQLKCCASKEDPFIVKSIRQTMYAAPSLTLVRGVLPIHACLPQTDDPNEVELLCAKCKNRVKVKLKSLKDECTIFNDAEGEEQFRYDFNGSPASSSMRERCRRLADAVQLKYASIMPDIREKICDCLGCCVPSDQSKVCWFSLFDM